MDKRDSRLRLSVMFNLVLKALNMTVNFVLIPILIGSLGKEKYGIWVTIYAFINWLNIFDIGLGQGLKLKLTEAFSKNKINEIKKLIGSTYYFVSVISGFLFLVFLISYVLFNWSNLLNINEVHSSETNYSIAILVFFFLLVFITKLIGVIYASLQLPFVENIIKTLGQVFFLALIILLNYSELKLSLIWVSIFSIVPLFLIYFWFNVYFFKIKSPSLFPRIKNISKDTLRNIVKPGASFFIIQIGCIILYSTDNLIIINLMPGDAVADYNVYYKYYSIPFLFYNIYIASHWSSFIDAIAKNDFLWIRNKINLFNKLFLLLIISYVVLFFINEVLIEIWIGKEEIPVDNSLSFYMIMYYLISSFATNYIFVINAFGKLRVQLLSYVVIAIINIPLSIFLVKYFEIGSSGVILSSLICLSILSIMMPIQYYKIVNNKVNGIWNK
ncbi:lipopolysaccharide biosynthesis protein [Seonamhaeicola maritimus]|uniref:lipopolysaccharide biosynthesis protein n=1 Tax=Seonamhaeicola maritimus TaxID=2591822 RepID=UPI0024946D38|nr:oligosaccharide flippase family protein [Seonamhaeicola maritimus]